MPRCSSCVPLAYGLSGELSAISNHPSLVSFFLGREGLAVEDIEESLGLPRGWTFVEGQSARHALGVVPFKADRPPATLREAWETGPRFWAPC